jgi:hypothetical protein
MAAPHLTHRRDVIDAVVARAQRGAAVPSDVDAAVRMTQRRDTPTPASSPPSTVAADEPDDPVGEPLAEPTHASGFGGVWYLVRLITELDVMVRLARYDAERAPELLAAVVGHVTGVSVDDPAVVLLAGVDDGRSDDGHGADADAGDPAIVHELAGDLSEELLQRGGGRLVGRDLGELWRRPAEMTVGVGTIDVVFDLDDVDIDVRVLGLDVDPGFVWWSGSIVRFDYV